MTNIQELIEQTLTLASEATEAGNISLAKTYMEDRWEFMNIQYLLKAGYTKAAAKVISNMGSAPREQVIEAIIKDKTERATV